MTTTIGSQTNVPDPGSPITSPWAQDTARKLVHTFANQAARDAWAAPPNGAMCVTNDTDQLWQYRSTAWVAVDSQPTADARYLNTTGDTATGILIVGTGGTGVGVTQDPTGQILVTRNAAGTSNIICDRRVAPATDAGQPIIGFQRIGTLVGRISFATTSTVAYETTSDPRLKERTGDADDAAELIQRLGGAVFRGRWIDPATDQAGGDEWVLVSSHDVEDVAPYAVSGERDAVTADGDIIPQQVNFPALVPLLCAALSQALSRIDALEAQL